jgi:hypothetical protein
LTLTPRRPGLAIGMKLLTGYGFWMAGGGGSALSWGFPPGRGWGLAA